MITLSQPSPRTSNWKPEEHDGARGSNARDAFDLESDDSDDITLVPSARDDRGKADFLTAISGSSSKPSTTSSVGYKNSCSLPGRAESGRSAARGGTNSIFSSRSHEKGKMRPFLEAFERFMNEEDFCVDSPSARGKAKPPCSSVSGDSLTLTRSGRVNGVGGGSSGEISFTRVRRVRRPLNEGD